MSARWGFVLGVALCASLATSAFAAALVAPTYPGAVRRSATSDAVVYLSKSPPAQVRAFYA